MSEFDNCPCPLFFALDLDTGKYEELQRAAALRGEEPPGLHNSLCGTCVSMAKIDAALGVPKKLNQIEAMPPSL